MTSYSFESGMVNEIYNTTKKTTQAQFEEVKIYISWTFELVAE